MKYSLWKQIISYQPSFTVYVLGNKYLFSESSLFALLHEYLVQYSITSLTGEFGTEDFELIPHSPVRYLFIFAFVLIHDGSNIQLHN